MKRVHPLLVAVVLLQAWPAAGEVRLNHRGPASRPTVDVVSTPSGPWTPVGAVSSSTLNPAGDILGDGFPGVAFSGAHVIVAWRRPTEDTLLVALADGGGWASVHQTAASQAVGTPHPIALDTGWIILWQQASDSGDGVLATTFGTGGQPGDTTMLASGRLAAATSLADSTYVVVEKPDAGAIQLVGIVYSVTPDYPIPIPISRTLYDLGDFVSGPLRGHSVTPDYPLRISGGRHRSLVGAGHQPAPSHADWFADVRITDGENSFGKFGLVTWWRQPGELAYVELREDGPVLPVDTLESRGEAAYPQ